ncbi:unnamed protein product [Linum trigynum]|uniref:Uncharacterized protein n=1 Tax=Linum trigynum TaxID=586398 RepID=A0AAV2E1L8_9ROSI
MRVHGDNFMMVLISTCLTNFTLRNHMIYLLKVKEQTPLLQLKSRTLKMKIPQGRMIVTWLHHRIKRSPHHQFNLPHLTRMSRLLELASILSPQLSFDEVTGNLSYLDLLKGLMSLFPRRSPNQIHPLERFSIPL